MKQEIKTISKSWVTSDLHFGHKRIMEFCPNTRKYLDVDHMNSSMIKEWNASVSVNDTVYLLGDVAFYSPEKAANIMHQLNGTKILIIGNHDTKNLKDPVFASCFVETHQIHEMNYNGTHIVMCHFPFMEWNKMHRGSVHLYGHVHGNATGLEKYRARDAGVDATGNVVTSLDDIVKDALSGEIKQHH